MHIGQRSSSKGKIKIYQDGLKGWIRQFETDYAKRNDVRRNVKRFFHGEITKSIAAQLFELIFAAK